MVTNQTYKNYSSQIAALFCDSQANVPLCKASITERLNTYLDDYTYPFFLAKLPSGRQYITNLESFQNKGFGVVITDLITGLRETAWWVVAYNYPYLGKLPGELLKHQYNIISANKTFDEKNKSNYRITFNPIKQSYGITFVPGSVGTPGGSGTPGGGTPGGGGTIIQTPSQPQPLQPVEGGIGLKSLLENPIVLIGGAVVLFLLMKDKF